MASGNEDMKFALGEASKLASQGKGEEAQSIVTWAQHPIVLRPMLNESTAWTAISVLDYLGHLRTADQLLPRWARFASPEIAEAAAIIPT